MSPKINRYFFLFHVTKRKDVESDNDNNDDNDNNNNADNDCDNNLNDDNKGNNNSAATVLEKKKTERKVLVQKISKLEMTMEQKEENETDKKSLLPTFMRCDLLGSFFKKIL